MKKVIVLAIAATCLQTAAYSQGILEKAEKAVAGASTSNGAGAILQTLTSKLGLSTAQKPQVADIVGQFLTQKSALSGTEEQKKTKFGQLFAGLKTKLAAVLTAVQLQKLLSLKPAAGDTSNPLSKLFNL